MSTNDQHPDRQIQGLKPFCTELHIEQKSATAKSRPVYEELVASLGRGDMFVVWDLDRAFRSARDAINELENLRVRGIEFHIANFNLDTSTPYGKLVFTFISGLAEFERDLLSQRTKEGIEAARKKGKRIGRPPKMTKTQLRAAAHRISRHDESYCTVAKTYGVAPWTLSRALDREGIVVME